ncbi:MAG: hypothetical protein PSW75_09910 [bacterium]|nr:hypothetical protein [bacterium]
MADLKRWAKTMADECSICRPATDAEKAEAQKKFFAAVQRVGAHVDVMMRNDLSRSSFADSVAGMEQIPMFVLSFPNDSALSGFHFAFTVEYLLKASEEEIAAGLAEDIERQVSERTAELPWWKRIFRR